MLSKGFGPPRPALLSPDEKTVRKAHCELHLDYAVKHQLHQGEEDHCSTATRIGPSNLPHMQRLHSDSHMNPQPSPSPLSQPRQRLWPDHWQVR